MELLFKRGDVPTATFWDKLILAATGGPYVHTELRFGDGRCFSSQAPHGVRILDSIDTSDPKLWDVMRLPWKETPELVTWAESQVGLPYDYVGALSAAAGTSVCLAAHWFCSEISIEGMSRVEPEIYIPPLLTPEALYNWMFMIFHKAIQVWLDASVKRHHAHGRRLTNPANVPMSDEERLVQGWLVQLDQHAKPFTVNAAIERRVRYELDKEQLPCRV